MCSAAGGPARRVYLNQERVYLNQDGADQLGEAVSGPIQAALDRPQIAPGDLGNLLVALPFKLPQDEHLPVVFRQALNTLIHGVLQEALAVQVVGPRGRILELQRPMVGFPVLLDRLEED